VSSAPTQLTLAELEQAVERDLGTSSWHRIEQRAIDLFAEATGDHQWIHVDPQAAAQGPFGTTVAHGYLLLSLLPMLLGEVVTLTDARMGVNYGVERVRFTAPVPSGSEVRLRARLLSAERRGDGVRYAIGAELELRGSDKPAFVGEVVYLAF
jgi:acyl dehydratase